MTVRSTRHSLLDLIGPSVILSLYLCHYLYVLFSGYIKVFPDSDSEFYWRWSLDIWLGRSSLPFIGVPGYPFFLALSRVFFPTVELQVFLNHILTALAGVLLYFIVARFSNRRWALVGCLLFILYTPFMMYSSILTPEPLALFLMGVGLFLVIQKRLSCGRAVVSGVIFGLLSVVRPAVLMFGSALGVYLFLVDHLQEKWKGMLGYYLGFLVFPLLVIFVNGIGGGFWGVSTHAGINFYVGNSSYSTGTFYSSLPFRPTQAGFIEDARIVASKFVGRPLTHAQACRYWMEKTMEYIWRYPWDWLRLMGRKLLLLYNRQEYHDANWESMRIPVLPFLNFSFIFPFSLLALWTTRKNRLVGVLRLALVLISLSTILVFINTRYKLMIVFPAIALASLGLRDFIGVVRDRRYGTSLLYFFALIGLFGIGQLSLVKLVPSTKAVRFNQAMELFEGGNISASETIFKEILREDPRDYLTWFALGNVYYAKKRFEDALRCYERSNRLNPLFADAVYNYGICAMELGDYKKAYVAFRQIYDVSPRKPDVILNLAYSMAKLGMCRDALSLLDRISNVSERVSDSDIDEVRREIDRCQRDM